VQAHNSSGQLHKQATFTSTPNEKEAVCRPWRETIISFLLSGIERQLLGHPVPSLVNILHYAIPAPTSYCIMQSILLFLSPKGTLIHAEEVVHSKCMM